MNDNAEKHDPVEFTVYETAQARADMRFRSMLWVIVFLIIMLVGTNGAWLYHESQYEDIVSTVSQDAMSDSGDAIINGDNAGAVIYGYEGKTNRNN